MNRRSMIIAFGAVSLVACLAGGQATAPTMKAASSARVVFVRVGLEADGFDVSLFRPQRFTRADLAPGTLVVALDAEVDGVVGETVPVSRWDGLPSVIADYAGARNALVVRVQHLVDSLVQEQAGPGDRRDGLLGAGRAGGERANGVRAAPTCVATPTSMTPTAWRSPAIAASTGPKIGLKLIGEVALPGPANRFDYQSVDPTTGRIYMNHMNAGRTVVFDADSGRVISEIKDVSRATGVLAIPSHHQVYISAAGSHDVAIVDDRTLTIASRVGGIRFPDGIAFAPDVDKVFVSDESGDADVVIDATTASKRSTIDLGGEAGNTHYDSVSHCVLVAVQTKNQIVAIDPVTERIVQRYDLPGSDHPHGFTIDQQGRLAFVSCEGNAALLVVDLRTMKIVQNMKVADGPDVLAWDPGWRRLYVSSEGGALQAFWLDGAMLRPAGEVRAPHAHTVSVDPRTHKVYLPLENIDGRPVLRIFQPSP